MFCAELQKSRSVFERDALQAIRAYAAGKGNENASAMTVRDAFPEMIFGKNEIRDDVNKISYVLRGYTDFLDAKKAFPSLKCETWGGVKETPLFGDIGVPDISKASAVSCLLAHLHRTFEDTIAFGDAKIDIPMFACCAYSVCMGNGGPEAKAAADFVADDVGNDGLYKAFQQLKLIS